jgi:hypothetical protein
MISIGMKFIAFSLGIGSRSCVNICLNPINSLKG